MYYIYKMIHKPTGRVYVGQRKCPKGKTPDTDTAYNGSGKIWRAIWRKHMDECCKVILDIATSKTAIDDLERKYISHYKGVMGDYCVNIAPGGEGVGSGEEHPLFGKHHSEESKRKMSESTKGAKHPNFGKHLSEETKRRISEACKGKQLSEETRAKISESLIGENNPWLGKHHSEETKRRISEARKGKIPWTKGKHRTEETKSKLSSALKGRVSPMKGRHLSEEAKRKLSEARKRYFEKKRLDKDISKV